MSFPLKVRLEALIACQRYCCLCHQRKHTRIQCHHIVQEADNGANTFENCIPLCPDCHAEVGAFNPHHPFGGTPYSKEELMRRRDHWYAVIRQRSEVLCTMLHKLPASYPQNTALVGNCSFNYSQFDGTYLLGEGNSQFLSRWGRRGTDSVYCYQEGTNVSVAITSVGVSLSNLTDASLLHFGSRFQAATAGRLIVLENHASRYAAIRVTSVTDSTRTPDDDRLTFDYWILDNGSDDFSNFV